MSAMPSVMKHSYICFFLSRKNWKKNRKLLHFNSADYQKISEIADENLAEKKLYVQKHIEKIIIDPKRKKIKKIIFKS